MLTGGLWPKRGPLDYRAGVREGLGGGRARASGAGLRCVSRAKPSTGVRPLSTGSGADNNGVWGSRIHPHPLEVAHAQSLGFALTRSQTHTSIYERGFSPGTAMGVAAAPVTWRAANGGTPGGRPRSGSRARRCMGGTRRWGRGASDTHVLGRVCQMAPDAWALSDPRIFSAVWFGGISAALTASVKGVNSPA